MSKKELLHIIELKRLQLNNCVSEYGLSSSYTLQISQELDQLLNQYNSILLKKPFGKKKSLIVQ
ncbi:aspartyl-phosphate phosphatase Spo0E family protein [Peribacillus tepidiphilus]|uniref:aspartyl-phosphate phosphatase Spo0E family protein n=1 Tax=Peribacillus tepidiphilus TaxID=2652445 RepID=UPI001291B29E|nr:aspartyl-phosphate phosphatase Spo0E family protein [Peribacillus tepidiphilus]